MAGNMKTIFGVFFLVLSITSSSTALAAPVGKRITTMDEFSTVVCAYVERKMKDGLNDRGVEKLISEYAQTIEILSSIYNNLNCARK